MRCRGCSRHLLYPPLVLVRSHHQHVKRSGRGSEEEGVVVGAEEGTAMRRGTWVLGAAACATVLGILIGFHGGSTPDITGNKPHAPPALSNPDPPSIPPPHP